MKSKWFLPALMFLLMATLAHSPLTAQESTMQSMQNEQLVYVLAGQADTIPAFVPPPVGFIPDAPTANIIVNYNGSWTGQAQTAFEYAVTIWEGLLVSGVTIEVDAEWTPMGTGILGGAGPYTFWRDFAGAPQSGTWYPAAIANRLAGTDLNGGTPEIDAAFSSSFTSWYFGTDGNPPSNKYDFVSVVLHELGHGLGFIGSMDVIGGIGYWGSGTAYPFIYDRFAENGAGQALLSFTNGSSTLAAQLTGGSVYFDGPNANAANGGSRPRLYAPGTWQDGSSYSHLDETTYPAGTANALMTYAISNGEANHSPGPVTLGIFQDSGWVLASQNTAPVMNNLPGQILTMGTTRNNAIDLWAYTSDAQTGDSGLTFAITNTPNASAGVSLDSNRYIDIFPNPSWVGTTEVTVRVTDPSGLTDTDTFVVASFAEIITNYLPLMRGQ